MSEKLGANETSEFAQIIESGLQITYISPDDFASLVGSTRQTISYHLRQGILKRWVDSADIKTEPYQIPEHLVEWFIANNNRKTSISAPKSSQKITSSQTLVSENSSHIFEKLIAKYEDDLRKQNDSLLSKDEQIVRMQTQMDDLRKHLEESRIQHSQLKGRLETISQLLEEKDKTIQAKDQAINAANAAVLLLEQQKPALEADIPKQITAESEPKKGWFDKILGR